MSIDPQQVPIPQPFQSIYLEGLFTHCVDCECDLLDSNIPYTVVKHVVGQEPVFEMALCLECAANLRSQYSVETQQRLNEFLEQAQRREPSPVPDDQDDDFTWEDGIAACFSCGKPRQDCRRYELAGVCLNEDLLVQAPTDLGFTTPFLLCDDCNEQISKLISRQTRDAWDRFMEDHFDSPPGIELDSPRFDPILI